MSDSNRSRKRPTPRPQASAEVVYARTAADDAAGTACEAQAREARRLVQDAGSAAVYVDPGRSSLDVGRPGLRRLLADVRRGDLRRVVVRDLTRLARSAALLESILGELHAAGVELVTAERDHLRA